MQFSSSAVSEHPLSAVGTTSGTFYKTVAINAVLRDTATKTVVVDAILHVTPIRATRVGARAISSPNVSIVVTRSAVRAISDYFTDPNLARVTRTGIRAISSFYGRGTKTTTINAVLVQVASIVRRIYWTF